MEISEVSAPLRFTRTNQRVLERLIKTIPFIPQSLGLEFYADKNFIPDYSVSFYNEKREITNRTGDENIFLEGKPQNISIHYKGDYSIKAVYKKLIRPALKNKYKINKASFAWDYKFDKSYLARERATLESFLLGDEKVRLLRKNFSVKVNVYASENSHAGFEVRSSRNLLCHSINDGANISISNSDENCEFLSFIKKRDEEEMDLLRNWFEYLKDFSAGQKYFVENPFPAGSFLKQGEYQWFWKRE